MNRDYFLLAYPKHIKKWAGFNVNLSYIHFCFVLFVRLLIAAAACMCALLMVRVEGLLRESFIAHITDVRTLSRVLSTIEGLNHEFNVTFNLSKGHSPLVNNQMTFTSELHVTVRTRMI